MPITENPNLIVECSNQVVTIKIRPREAMTPEQAAAAAQAPAGALALANLFDELRADDSIRVIVMHRGGETTATFRERFNEQWKAHHNDPVNIWRTFTGIIRMHEVMASIEKPIIAQVNGDIIRGATNIVLAADFIVAREDAKFIDTHLGTREDDPEFGLVPGDGGLSLVPLFMTPPLAKEFLMLAREYTMKELAERGIINYAVPADQVEIVVNDLVQGLLRRPAYPIAWAKRVANRHVIDQLNRTLDAAAGYEMIGLAQLERQGWIDKTRLD